jgi:hypothetical protein
VSRRDALAREGAVAVALGSRDAPYDVPSRSITNTSGALGGIDGGDPFAP